MTVLLQWSFRFLEDVSCGSLLFEEPITYFPHHAGQELPSWTSIILAFSPAKVTSKGRLKSLRPSLSISPIPVSNKSKRDTKISVVRLCISPSRWPGQVVVLDLDYDWTPSGWSRVRHKFSWKKIDEKHGVILILKLQSYAEVVGKVNM